MSITRLQQARQMYAMGQRVGRIAFGGGGSYSFQGGYQGGQNESDKATGGQGGSSGTGTDNKGSTGGNNDNPFSSGYQGAVNQTKTATPMDVKEQYAVGDDITLGAPIAPTFMSPQLETNRHNNYLDALNLAGSTYKPLNIPPFVPGGMLLNTVGNFIGGIGAKKNRQFFADNVAGKYGFGYGMDAYKDYMRQRMAGNVGAYGNEEQGQNALNRGGGDDGGGGIMDVNTDITLRSPKLVDDTTADVEFVSRYLQNQPEDIRKEIESRMKNYYTV